MRKIYSLLVLMMALVACNDEPKKVEIAENTVEEPVPVIRKEYGFVLNDYEVVRDTVQSGDTFGNILGKHGVGPGVVYQIVHEVEDTFDPRKIMVGTPYMILKTTDSVESPEVFVYANDLINYTVINLRDSISAYTAKKPVTIKTRSVSGVINSSLSEAIDREGLDYYLAHEMNSIYMWSIDFFRLQKGDRFKLIFKEKYIEDSIYAGIESIDAAVFYHADEPYYAFKYEADSIAGEEYYDEKASPLQSFFLRAPLNYTRISSRYSPRRFHPVQRRWKAHKGTDYAAPTGTPIWSTANGVVIASSYTSGNGNYVKIRHNGTYTTQYLHMSRRAVKKGERVQQGDVIGYVGSTGLATGPHVCYRFWVNGRQVDPYKQELPDAEPMDKRNVPAYLASIEPVKAQLESIPFSEISEKNKM